MHPAPRLKPLTAGDARAVRVALRRRRHDLSVYAFENIYIWRGLYRLLWTKIGTAMCIFFQDRIGCFMYLAPLAGTISAPETEQAFAIMDRYNQHPGISRIENVEEPDILLYGKLGYECVLKSHDYLYDRRKLAELKGNSFKSKRAGVNRFMRRGDFSYIPYRRDMAAACIGLYGSWMRERAGRSGDPIYTGMLKDSLTTLSVLLQAKAQLRVIGRVILIDGQVRAFTFGYAVNPDTFCVLFEVADLSVPGLSQFIFRQLCAELREFTYINAMDDSGLENLRRVKLSYHPLRMIPAYTVQRRHASQS